MSINPGEASASTSTNAADPRRKISPPSALSLGIIVWTDDPEVEPTVIAGRNPVALARAVAVHHEMLEDSEVYAALPS